MTVPVDSEPASLPALRDLWISPSQWAAARILLSLLVLIYLGFFPQTVPLEESGPNAWLELPRIVRGLLRLSAFIFGGLLLAGWWKRPVGGATLALIAVLAAYGRVDPLIAGVLCACLVVVLIPGGDDPAALPPFASRQGAEPAKIPFFKRALWVGLSLPMAAGLLLAQNAWSGPLQRALGFLLLADAVFLSVRGAQRGSALAMFTAWAVSLGVTAGPLALPLGCLVALLCLDREWLPPRPALLSPEAAPLSLEAPDPPIVFYDGVCGLCQRSIQLILAEDRDGRLKCAPLQGTTAQRLLGTSPDQEFDSLKLYDAGILYERSAGALRIASYLGGFWTLLSWLRRVPEPLRDAAYDFVAQRRYAWFGKLDACRIPTPGERQRFLD